MRKLRLSMGCKRRERVRMEWHQLPQPVPVTEPGDCMSDVTEDSRWWGYSLKMRVHPPEMCSSQTPLDEWLSGDSYASNHFTTNTLFLYVNLLVPCLCPISDGTVALSACEQLTPGGQSPSQLVFICCSHPRLLISILHWCTALHYSQTILFWTCKDTLLCSLTILPLHLEGRPASSLDI